MTATRTIPGRIPFPAGGLLTVPATVIIVYGVLWHLIHISLGVTTSPFCYEFWSIPQYLGFSHGDLLRMINLLLALFLSIHFWKFASDKLGRSRRAVALWIGYVFLFVPLIGIEVYQKGMAEKYGLPEEILSLRLNEFHDLRGRGVEDVVLPRSDMCRGFSAPFEERCIINITRPGHFVRNRRDLGPVTGALDRIRSLLIDETARAARDPDGASRLILLIRADMETRFGPVHEVMALCGDSRIGIHRIELACDCDLKRRHPEAEKKLLWGYRLPEGRLDAYLPRGGSDVTTIDVEVAGDEGSAEGFGCKVNGQPIDGPGLTGRFFEAIDDLVAGDEEKTIVVRAQETIEYGRIIDLLAECRRAGAERVAFEILGGD